MRTILIGAVVSAFLVTTAQAVVLYDGSVAGTPQSQGQLAYKSLPIASVTNTSGGTTSLDTTANFAIGAGFATWDVNPITVTATQVNPAGLGSLNRNDGYTVRFDARLISESHNDANRAGLSLTVIGHDLKGIEIGFWPGEVWAQADAPIFTKAESQLFNTTTINSYELTVSGSTYSLKANGTTNLLSGNLRDYTAQGLPYNLPNFVFVGDNTTSATTNFQFSYLAVVPEPVGLSGLLLGMLLMVRRSLVRP